MLSAMPTHDIGRLSTLRGWSCSAITPHPPTPGPGAIGMLTLLCCHVLILSAPTPLLCAPCPAARATRAQPFRELAASSPFGAVSADTKGTSARHAAGSRTANLHKDRLHAERACVQTSFPRPCLTGGAPPHTPQDVRFTSSSDGAQLATMHSRSLIPPARPPPPTHPPTCCGFAIVLLASVSPVSHSPDCPG